MLPAALLGGLGSKLDQFVFFYYPSSKIPLPALNRALE